MPPLREVEPVFEREQGCTEAEWLSWLPGAVRGHALHLRAPGHAQVMIGAGRLELDWTVLPPRQIALIRMPRLRVGFRFVDVDGETRSRFMQYFDLFLQRGGG
jgi:hypothetical protein